MEMTTTQQLDQLQPADPHAPFLPPNPTPPPAALAAKLARAAMAMGDIPETGFNSFDKYHYSTINDILRTVREALFAEGVAVLPSVVHLYETEVTTKGGGTQALVSVWVRFTMVDGESGEMCASYYAGQAMDRGDKAYFKAYSGVVKYWALQTFMLPRGLDAEADSPERGDSRAQRPRSAQNEKNRGNGKATKSAQQTPTQTAQSAADKSDAKVRKALLEYCEANGFPAAMVPTAMEVLGRKGEKVDAASGTLLLAAMEAAKEHAPLAPFVTYAHRTGLLLKTIEAWDAAGDEFAAKLTAEKEEAAADE